MRLHSSTRLFAALLSLALAACSADGGGSTIPDAGSTDGSLLPDSSASDAAIDATSDAGPGDAGLDASPDAGPSCMCPTLPTRCSPPPSGDPRFTPDLDGTYGEQLLSLVACADTRIQLAIYSADWSCLLEAIRARLAETPGLTLEVVTDDDQCPVVAGSRGCALSIFDGNPQVTVVDDARSRLMHHKFLVADGTRAWLGSANFTQQSFCRDVNDGLILTQPALVQGLVDEFNRFFVDGAFGPVPTAEPIVAGPYSLYFSPQTPVDSPSRWFDDLITRIDASTGWIRVMIFALTRSEISDALIRAKDRGVSVRVLVNPRFGAEAAVDALRTAGIEVREASVHAKVLAMDGRFVATGSANWSAAAWANDENSLFIDDPAIALSYEARFDLTWADATP
ncbi:MAG: hypothetical protein GXP55_13760 [Deltaproteobacteria bacterium]|nr:hypothetical protein [Deltaproteobacteria bacterium]